MHKPELQNKRKSSTISRWIIRGVIEYALLLTTYALNIIVFLRYTLWGYKLPPMPPVKLMFDFMRLNGVFQAHNMIATFKKSTGSTINMTLIVGQPPMIYVEDPVHIEQLLTDKDTFPTRGKTGFDFWVPQGLLGLETGPQWALHRQLVSRCFTTNFLKLYTATINSKCRNLLKAFDKQVTTTTTTTSQLPHQQQAHGNETSSAAVDYDGGSTSPTTATTATIAVDVQPMLVRTALDIIASVCFGLEFDTLANDTVHQWAKAADTILDETLLLTVMPPCLRLCVHQMIDCL